MNATNESVLAFIRRHPGCTCGSICCEFLHDAQSAKTVLRALMDRALIRCVRIDNTYRYYAEASQ